MVNRQPATIDTSIHPSYNGCTAIQHPPNVCQDAVALIRGRAPKITPELVSTLIDALSEGMTISQACKKAGISKATYYVWNQISQEFSDLCASTRATWTDSIVDRGLTELTEVQANDSSDSSKVRKAEVIARHTLEIAGRLNPAYAAKSQSTNLNVNVEIDPVDLSKYMG